MWLAGVMDVHLRPAQPFTAIVYWMWLARGDGCKIEQPAPSTPVDPLLSAFT